MSGFGKSFKTWEKLLKGSGDRVRKGRKKFKNTGTYTANDLAADMVETWFEGVQAWLDIGSSSTTVPVCYITGAGGAGGGSVNNILSLPDSLKVLPASPDLLGIKDDGSGTDIIKKAKVTLAFVDVNQADEILVTVDLKNATAGRYQGLLVDGTALLGTIIVQVT